MKTFTLKLSNGTVEECSWNEKFEEIVNLKRKYQAIDVDLSEARRNNNSQDRTDKLLNILSVRGCHITSFDINFAGLTNIQVALKMLIKMPSLKSMNMLELKLEDSEQIILPVTLKHLESLETTQDNLIWLRYISALQLVSLNIHCSDTHNSSDIITFLKALPKLKLLGLGENAFTRVFQIDCKFPFKLEKFKVLDFEFGFELNKKTEDIFCDFLTSQASSLRELEIECKLSDRVHEIIFTQLCSLKRIQTVACILPDELIFYEKLRPIVSLNEIFSEYGFTNRIAAKGILINAPSLKKLDVPMESDLLEFIAINNPMLVHLTLQSINFHLPMEVRFEFIESLTLMKPEFLTSFLEKHQTIKCVRINDFNESILKDEVLDALMSFPSFNCLKLFGELKNLEKVFEEFSPQLENRKSVKLEMSLDKRTEEKILFLRFSDKLA